MKKSTKITKHYCWAYVEAAMLGLYDHCKYLSKKKEFDPNYIDRRSSRHICVYAASIGDFETFNKGFSNLIESEEISSSVTMLDLIVSAATSGNMNTVECIMTNVDLFRDNTKDDYQHNINTALRSASENGHAKLVDYFISKGAKPNDWHVLHWSAKSAPGNTYRKILKACGLDPKSNRKKIVKFCVDKTKECGWVPIDIDELKEFLKLC